MEIATQNGAVHIPFNPLTSRTCIRELKRIAKAERLTKSDAEIEALVSEAQNDLHNAVQGLQLQAVGDKLRRHVTGPPKSKESGKSGELQRRDMGLPIFHALGKILYNKRHVHVKDSERAQAGYDALNSL